MPFKKLRPELQEKLAQFEIATPTLFQKKSIPVIKSGANVYCVAPKGSGKTTTLILTTLQELKCEEIGMIPRALIMVENKEKALELYDAFLEYTKHTSLRVYVGHEGLHIDLQKSEIFMGVDILISTPKNMKQLFLLNGIGIAHLKMFSVDDAEFLTQKQAYSSILSMAQSIKKCQYVLYCEKLDPMLKRLESHFMEFPKKIVIKE